jgi:hypothetical protein
MWYWRQSSAVAGRMQIVERDHGTHTLVSSSYKPEWGDEATLDDETQHWSDERNNMGRLFGRPIGFISERINVIAHPRHCEVGREHLRQEERGETTVKAPPKEHDNTEAAADGGQPVEVPETRVELPDQPRLVSAHNLDGVLGDSASPRLGEVGYEFTKLSQQGFSSRSIIEAVTFIMAYAASFGLIWFISENSSSLSRSVSLFMAGGLL